MYNAESQDYKSILLQSSGLLDVRAPIEFEQGAFPTAANLPLLNNEERHRVGVCYKQQGKQSAIATGHNLVSGNIKKQRVEQWIEFTRRHKDAYLYCFRGGLRSQISQQWLHEAGVNITRVHGGYKALRNYLLTQIANAPNQFSFVLVGGMTGCQKTTLINQLDNGVDLEGAAYHRGSSFGAHAIPQSSQINFENRISIDLLNAQQANLQTLTLEDEGRFIGSVDIPNGIYSKMRASPLVVVERNFEARVQQLLKEYVTDMAKEYSVVHDDQEIAFENYSMYLLESLFRIRKRLGDQCWLTLQKKMQSALHEQQQTGSTDAHLRWLTPLLTEYYDPMYQSQINNRKDKIIFRGDFNSCLQFLNTSAINCTKPQ